MLERCDAPAPSVENALSRRPVFDHAAKVLFSFRNPDETFYWSIHRIFGMNELLARRPDFRSAECHDNDQAFACGGGRVDLDEAQF
jgi:hypothetical protein